MVDRGDEKGEGVEVEDRLSGLGYDLSAKLRLALLDTVFQPNTGSFSTLKRHDIDPPKPEFVSFTRS